MMNRPDYPKFSIDTKNRNLIITSGLYNNTVFKVKRIRIEEQVLKYDVEIMELYVNGGNVENAHENELQDFINIEALSVVKRLMDMAAVVKSL